MSALTDGLDAPEWPGMAVALEEARARPWKFRLSEPALEWARLVFHTLSAEGRNGALVQAAGRALALDEEARRAARNTP